MALVRGEAEDSQRSLEFFDAGGAPLGSIALENSANAEANSIAYGTEVAPNLDGGKGLMLLTQKGGTDANRTASVYPDPLAAEGASLARMSPCAQLSLLTPGSTTLVDEYMRVRQAPNGRLMVSLYRTGAPGGPYSYAYFFKAPRTATANANVALVTPSGESYVNMDSNRLCDVVFGNFKPSASVPTNSFRVASMRANGLVYFGYVTVGDISFHALSGTYDCSVAGRAIAAMWQDDDSTLAVCYDDGSVRKISSEDGSLAGTASFQTQSRILDVVRLEEKASGTYARRAASYMLLARGAAENSQRSLNFFDAEGRLLDTTLLEDSASADANAFAYGDQVAPNLDGANGLMLLTQKSGSIATRTTNVYADPVLEKGASLNMLAPCSKVSLLVPEVIMDQSNIYDIKQAPNGRVMSLEYRTTAAYGYFYFHKVPETAAGNVNLPLVSPNTESYVGIHSVRFTKFAFGDFLTSQTVPDNSFRVAMYGESSKNVNFGYVTVGDRTFRLFSQYYNFTISGKTIKGVLSAENGNVGVLYDDGLICEYSPSTGAYVRSLKLEMPAGVALDCLKVTPQSANPPAWIDAAYMALVKDPSGADNSQRSLEFFDAEGVSMGVMALEGSEAAQADAIAYGNGLAPNIAGKGLLLLTQRTGGDVNRFVKVYADPLANGETSLPLASPCSQMSFPTPASTVAVDNYMKLFPASGGKVAVLNHRSADPSRGEYFYFFTPPAAATGNISVPRDSSNGYIGLGNTQHYTALAKGGFMSDLVAASGSELYAFYDSLTGDARFATVSATSASYLTDTVRVAKEGKTVKAMWAADNGRLAVLYDDGSVSEWDAELQSEAGGFSFSTSNAVLDVVRLTAASAREEIYDPLDLSGVVLEGEAMEAEIAGGAINAECLAGEEYPVLNILPAGGGSWDFSGSKYVALDVENTSGVSLRVEAWALADGGWSGASTYPLPSPYIYLAAGERKKFVINLNSIFQGADAFTPCVDASKISRLRLAIGRHGGTQTVAGHVSWYNNGGTLKVHSIGLSRTPAKVFDAAKMAARYRVPPILDEAPAEGKRTWRALEKYSGTSLKHVISLPENFDPAKKYPIIVEYTGNVYYNAYVFCHSTGYASQANMAAGLSRGEDYICLVLPFVSPDGLREQFDAWGDPEATVQYCLDALADAYQNYSGDKSAVFFTGFSRGRFSMNYIGLRGEEISKVWLGFVGYNPFKPAAEQDDWNEARTGWDERADASRGKIPYFVSDPAWTNVHVDTQYLEDSQSTLATKAWMADVLQNRVINAEILSGPADVISPPGGAARFEVSARGTDVAYQWQSSPDGETWTDMDGATSAALSFTNLAAAQSGTQYRCLVSNSRDSDVSAAATLTVQAGATMPLSLWALNSGLEGSSASASAAPFGDGLTNLEKYAFGLDGSAPATLAQNPLICAVAAANGTAYQYAVSKQAEGITVRALWSTDLVNWSSDGMDVETLPDGTDANFKVFQASKSGVEPVFYRLEITESP